ncbi:MAG: hypothetical protein HUJ94_07230 [Bacteroidales bacterium]|nr:hypothetical protein [Bacteroidales bacterium]
MEKRDKKAKGRRSRTAAAEVEVQKLLDKKDLRKAVLWSEILAPKWKEL